MVATGVSDCLQIEKSSHTNSAEGNFCFRCGVCCTKYQVRLDLMETRRIANALGLALEEFLEKHVDKRWAGTESFLLRKRRGACVFLRCMLGKKQTICLIHTFRPSSCRKWMPGLHQRECLEGLAKNWGLAATTSGELVGSATKVQQFQQFQDLLRSEEWQGSDSTDIKQEDMI